MKKVVGYKSLLGSGQQNHKSLFGNRKVKLIEGGGLSVSGLNVYNPNNKKLTDDIINKIIEDKSFLTFHLNGNISKLKQLIPNLKYEMRTIKDNLLEGMYWYDLPEYKAGEKKYPECYIGFLTDNDKKDLLKKLDINITDNVRWVHYPNPIESISTSMMYKTKYTINPKYPIYIISKGRWEKRKTSKTLEQSKIPYKIVVEPKEYDEYAKVIDPKKIIKAPENFSERKQGGIPVRNFVWEHAVKSGAKKHWILDDNIDGFFRWNLSAKIKVVECGVLFKLIEDYVDRFTNIKQAGMNYFMFYPARQAKSPITFNTRIYSCILIDHSLKEKVNERWRGKYNEDTDLSLRILKAGYSTALFNAFLCGKETTLSSKGGNTDTIYDKGAKESLLAKAQSLVNQHPDVASVVKRYKRGIHHEVNYNKFNDNDLGYKNPNISKGVNNYNMVLTKK